MKNKKLLALPVLGVLLLAGLASAALPEDFSTRMELQEVVNSFGDDTVGLKNTLQFACENAVWDKVNPLDTTTYREVNGRVYCWLAERKSVDSGANNYVVFYVSRIGHETLAPWVYVSTWYSEPKGFVYPLNPVNPEPVPEPPIPRIESTQTLIDLANSWTGTSQEFIDTLETACLNSYRIENNLEVPGDMRFEVETWNTYPDQRKAVHCYADNEGYGYSVLHFATYGININTFDGISWPYVSATVDELYSPLPS